MYWKRILLSVPVLIVPHVISGESLSTSLDELLTYDCARSVATMVDAVDQAGPIFSQGLLVFTSVSASDGKPLLIATAGAGTYMVPLDHHGVNRIRFELPSLSSSKPQFFYLSYLHDPMLRSRVFEFSMFRAPAGKEELDYRLVRAQRAPFLQPHLEYAIWTTSAAVLGSLLDGHVKRDQMNIQKVECGHLDRRSPALSRNIRRNLDELEVMMKGPQKVAGATGGSRAPASAPGPAKVVKLP